MASDTAETVKRAREMLDSGVDPIVLMSQMATLMMDIIAGTYPKQGSFFGGRSRECLLLYSYCHFYFPLTIYGLSKYGS